MGRNASRRTSYPAHHQLATQPELARRDHTLPLAEDRGRVTVATASPNDAQARDADLTAVD